MTAESKAMSKRAIKHVPVNYEGTWLTMAVLFNLADLTKNWLPAEHLKWFDERNTLAFKKLSQSNDSHVGVPN